ncbi:MAG: hypothetical protein Q8P95_02850 [bacterium]|nr:hypothetical protein [bacterium]
MKNILAGLLAGLILALITACGGGSGSGSMAFSKGPDVQNPGTVIVINQIGEGTEMAYVITRTEGDFFDPETGLHEVAVGHNQGWVLNEEQVRAYNQASGLGYTRFEAGATHPQYGGGMVHGDSYEWIPWFEDDIAIVFTFEMVGGGPHLTGTQIPFEEAMAMITSGQVALAN